MKSHTTKILYVLEKGRSITPIQALEKFGCFRLAARINDLRQAGLEIKTEMIEKAGKKFARYTLIP